MTGAEVKSARQALGMTQAQLAEALKMKPPNGARRVRAWEDDKIAISGPAQVALTLLVQREIRAQNARRARGGEYARD